MATSTSQHPQRPLFYHEQVAIIYIRVSTEYQTKADSNSIETQKRLCRDLCERKGIPVAKIIEQVKSGRKDRRELIDIVEKELKRGDAIVVWAVSRFARSQRTTHNLVDTLAKKKCRLLSYSENLDTSEDDKFLGLHAWIAEMESKQISDRVKMSLASKKMRGEHTGRVPFGYRFVDGKGSPLEQDPEKMALVERMREMHEKEKMSFHAISQRLNAEGILSPTGQKLCGWMSKTVKQIINRDDSAIRTLGKRSWYMENDPDQVQGMEFQETVTETTDSTSNTQSITKEETAPPDDNKAKLPTKSAAVLRALVMKRKYEFGLTDNEIREMSAEDLALILS